MGYRSNPILLRLGGKANWISNDYRKYDYSLEVLKNTQLYGYLDSFFTPELYKRRVLFFSHLNLRRAHSIHILNIFMWDRKFNFIKRKWRRRLIKKYNYKVYSRRYGRYLILKNNYKLRRKSLSKLFYIVCKFILPYVRYYHLLQLRKFEVTATARHYILSKFISIIVYKTNLLNLLVNLRKVKSKFAKGYRFFKFINSLKNYILSVLNFIKNKMKRLKKVLR
jgi:hypothetical protein